MCWSTAPSCYVLQKSIKRVLTISPPTGHPATGQLVLQETFGRRASVKIQTSFYVTLKLT